MTLTKTIGLIAILALCLFGVPLASAQLTNVTGTINGTAAAVSAVDAANTTLTVSSTAGFAACDEVLVIQMKGAAISTTNSAAFGDVTNYGQAGVYEFAIVSSVGVNSITLAGALSRTFTPSAENAVQIIKVAKFSDAQVTGTLTAPAWNGSTGGVLVLNVEDTLSIVGIIDMNAKGFRGGLKSNAAPSSPGPQLTCGNNFLWNSVVDASNDYSYDASQSYTISIPGSGTFTQTGDYWSGQKGEAIADRPTVINNGRGKLANGGGGGNNTQTGGGGGSNAGAGGVGGWSPNGCQGSVSFRFGGEGGLSMTTKYTATENVVFLGGGGGGPHFKGPAATVPGTGGNGGGIIIIKAGTILGSGTVRANGGVGGNGNYSGAGGGGGGGAIMAIANQFAGTLTINANGGAGGNTIHGNTNNVGPGGGGGGGVVAFGPSASTPVGYTITTAAGAAGLLTDRTPNITWGNTAGADGATVNGYSLVGAFAASAPAQPTVSGALAVCTGQSTTLTASSSAGVTFRWFDGSGNFLFAGNPFTSPVISGPTTYRVKAYVGTCDSSALTTVNVTVGGASLAEPAVNPLTICAGENANLSATPPAGAGIEWFDAATGGNSLGTGLTITQGPLLNNRTYYAESVQGGCRSATRAALVVTVNAAPTAGISPVGGPFCESSSTAIALSATPPGGTFSGAGVSGSNFTPSAAGVGTHTITYSGTSGGCAFSTTTTVTVNAAPTAGISPVGGPFCESSSTAIALSATPPGGTFSGAGVSGSNFTPSAAGVGTHTITYSGTSGGCAFSTTTTVTVNAAPTAGISPVGGPFCESSSTAIALSATPPGGTFSGAGVSGGNFTPSAAGVGTHTITYSGTSGGCAFSTTTTVTVNAAPTAGISPVGGPFCESSSTAIALSATPPGGTFSGAGVSGGNFTPSAAGVGTHTITYSGSSGGCAFSTTTTVTVNAAPTAGISPVGGPFCESSSTAIALSATPPGGTFSGAGVSGGNFTPSAAGVGTHTITYSGSSGGCAFSTTTTVTVNAAPTAGISPVGGPFCESSSTAIALSATPPGGTFSGAGVSGGNFTPNAAGVGTHTITYSGTSGGCAFSTTTTVTVNAAPTAGISPVGGPFCESSSTAIALSATPPGGTFSGAGVSGGNFTPSAAGVGTHTITYSGTSGGCAFSTTTTVTVNDVSAAITPATPQSICTGQSVVFNANTGAGFSYQWLLNGTPITGQTSATLTASLPGNYSVIVTNSGCSATSAVVALNVTPQTPLSLLPNVDTLDFYLNGPIVTLFTEPGLPAYQWWLLAAGGSPQVLPGTTAQLSFNGNSLAPGLYQIWVESNNGSCLRTSDTLIIRVQELPSALGEDTQVKWQVSPSPFSDHLLISSSDANRYNLMVYNTVGQLMFSATELIGNRVINTNDWSSGIYLLECTHPGSAQKTTIRVLKP